MTWNLVFVAMCLMAPHDCPQTQEVQVVAHFNAWSRCQAEADNRNGISTVNGTAVQDAVGRTQHYFCEPERGNAKNK